MKKIKRGALHKETLRLLKKTNTKLLIIHVETGLPYHWLQKFYYDNVSEPSVNRTEALYEYLSCQKLKF